MANTVEMVGRCPDTSFILDHIGKPDIRNGEFKPWKSQLQALSLFPNVVCKVSGMVTEADHESWSKENLKPYIDHVMECFGIDRVMFGGDWPVVTLAAEYSQWVEALDWATSGWSGEEMKKLYGDRLSFWGTVGTQTTMPFGTPAEVKAVVKERIETVG